MTDKSFTRRLFLGSASAGLLLPGAGFGQVIENPVEGGIGGTGIVGLLTEFGSLIVAGNYVRTDAQTQFGDGFGPLRERDLQLGDSLTIEASGPQDNLVARRVHVTHPLVGAIENITNGGRVLRINGVTVTLERPARGFDVGARVAVSGLWRGTQVQASRLSPARSGSDLVSGDVLRSTGVGALRIGGVALRGRGLGGRQIGSFATAIGRYDADAGVLNAARVSSGRFFGAAGPLQRLSIEGYVEPSNTAPGYRVAGLGHSFARNLQLAQYDDKRMLFNGPYTGRFAAKSAIELPETAARRTSVLGRLSQKNR